MHALACAASGKEQRRLVGTRAPTIEVTVRYQNQQTVVEVARDEYVGGLIDAYDEATGQWLVGNVFVSFADREYRGDVSLADAGIGPE